MTIKQILDRASAVLPSISRYYNDQGEYVEGEGDILAAYIAKVLIANYDSDPALEEEGQLILLVATLEQAMTDLNMVCEALETGEAPTKE